MNTFLPQNADVTLRAAQFRDLDAIAELSAAAGDFAAPAEAGVATNWEQVRTWYGATKILKWFPNPLQNLPYLRVAERDRQLCGAIVITPANSTRSTWRVCEVAVPPAARAGGIGSELLRHCFETILEARTWIAEIDINAKDALALARQNGFQPLAELTYWTLSPEQQRALGDRDPDLPNLLPVGNADAPLIYQLDTAAMPPHVRQVFDRHADDFRVAPIEALVNATRHKLDRRQWIERYVFEPQRKAAIGHFRLCLNCDGSGPHRAELVVHPAYTWLYPELTARLAQAAAAAAPAPLILTSADYQTEREAYFEQIGAARSAHALLLSRSVWHKLRESRANSLETLQDMLQGLQAAQPVANRN